MDETRFEREWRTHGRAVVGFCIFSTGSREDGEDIAAEVFTRLLSTRRRIEPHKTEAWLFTVARNLCVSHHRSAKRSMRLRQLILNDCSRPVAEAWRRDEVWEFVRKLDERSRLTIYLRIVEDRPFAEIARLTTASESAVKMRYYRALERLKEAMASDFGPGAAATSGGVSGAE